MIINLQGYGHFTDSINNQDYAYETPNFILVLDGCSESKYSEAGTRLFTQLFTTLKNYEKEEKFEENVKITFERLIKQLTSWFKDEDELQDFIMENMLFTILGCFKKDNEYVVKLFGDRLYYNRKSLWCN